MRVCPPPWTTHSLHVLLLLEQLNRWRRFANGGLAAVPRLLSASSSSSSLGEVQQVWARLCHKETVMRHRADLQVWPQARQPEHDVEHGGIALRARRRQQGLLSGAQDSKS